MTDKPVIADIELADERSRFWRNFGLGATPFVVGLALWELIGLLDIQSLKYVIPTPESVALALWTDIASGELLGHFLVTMSEVFLGLAIAVGSALILGLIIGRSPMLERTFYPAIVFFQAIPKVALAPLWLIVFGFGIGSKVALAAMVAIFSAARRRDRRPGCDASEELELMRSLRASQWQIFTKVQIPRALPSIFGGLEVGVLFALIGAVVGEFVGARAGLGYLIEFRSSRLDLPGVFSPLIVLALVGTRARSRHQIPRQAINQVGR